MKLVKKAAILLLICFIALQFLQPEKNLAQGNHTNVFLTETNPSREIRSLLKVSCYNCHSNHTEYPWYNNIAPVSYWLADHIKDGKRHLNFSEWENYSAEKKAHKLEELISEVETAKMPLNEYLWTHKEAKLSESEIEAMLQWAKQTKALYELNQLPK